MWLSHPCIDMRAESIPHKLFNFPFFDDIARPAEEKHALLVI